MLISSTLTVTLPDGTASSRECTTSLAMLLRNHDMFAHLADGGTDEDCVLEVVS